MSVVKRAVAVGNLVVVLALGCGDGPDTGPPADTFAVAFAGEYCDLLYRCCAPEDIIRLFYYGAPNRGVADCKERVASEANHNAQIIRERTAPLTYSPARAAACLSRLPKMTCEDLTRARQDILSPPWECGTVFQIHPAGALGSVCYQFYDCDPGLACDTPAHDHAGVCRLIADVPFACPVCDHGTYCDANADKRGICVPALADGIACTSDGRCANQICWGHDGAHPQPGSCGLPVGRRRAPVLRTT
jgi:hypothetical protein